MLLSDRQIAARIHEFFPFDHEFSMDLDVQIQPSSVDLRLDRCILYQRAIVNPHNHPIAIDEDDSKMWVEKDIKEGYTLYPGHEYFILGSTMETVSIPPDVCARVDGRSSLGRRGLRVHSTAGFIDPGFTGKITLEIDLVGRIPLILKPGTRVCQVSFQLMAEPVTRPYGAGRGSKYLEQSGPVSSRSYLDE